MARSRSKVRTLRFAAKLSQSQHRRLDDVMGMQQQLYNAGLESWRTGYRMWQQSPDPGRAKMRFSYKDNCKTLAVLRAEDPGWAALDTRVGRGTLQRLDRAIRGFYSSGRGYPRFKARDRWRTVWVPDAHEGMLRRPGEGGKWWKLAVKGMPGLRFCRVNPSHTSQDCSGCGQRLKDKLTLRERIFVCPQCGLIICRDINAAVNICDRGFPPAMPGGEPPGVRRETNFRHKTNRPPTTGGQAQPERTKPHRKHPAAHAA